MERYFLNDNLSKHVLTTSPPQDNVRLYKVHRNEQTGVQSVTETTVCVLLEGDIETS